MSGPHRRGNNTRGHSDYRAYSRSQRIIGPSAGRVPPAWRYQRPRAPQLMHESELVNLGGGYARLPQQEGSKIYISHLPPDVDDLDVNQLLTETIGPVIYAFVVYDVRGMTKMAAVASFVDPAHAAKAVELYNGKVIDGKEGIRVEQIGMNPKLRIGAPMSPGGNNTPAGQGARSLIDRVAQAPKPTRSLLNRVSAQPTPPLPAHVKSLPARIQPAQPNGNGAINGYTHPPPRPKRVKKGPKRLQKFTQLQQLEQEMDQYRNSAPTGLGLHV
ncbi:unnamed protein product [Rhizoctonia solani]|uniref:RRM domain-containing protein n=1 Tax=Rhizoctonia solani TaxID=456999 RepID=A0A8H3H2K4_9AGAM|nr:unnamed protein product [Rhizoctonia solani]CAE7234257.1 unnamed protein product [Rhizoctonia solani]